MRLRCIPFAALLAVVACMLTACVSVPERANGSFVERSIDVAGTAHRYQVFVPASAAGGRRPPVIMFLHGSGERGNDGVKQTQVGIGPYIRAHQDEFPAIVVFPQAPDDTAWSGNAGLVFAALDAATREFHGDQDRTYLTGLSMGGYGTWEMAMRSPGRFAALVPVCGGLLHPRRPSMGVTGIDGASDPYAVVADRLKGTPVWQFHGGQDEVFPPEYSRLMDAALKAAGARDARLTVFPDANHNSWDPAYSQTPGLWTWLFAQKR